MLDLSLLSELWTGIQKLQPLPLAEIQVEKRLRAAIDWIKRAHIEIGDGGISKGYESASRSLVAIIPGDVRIYYHDPA